ncbi:hypothetical protein FB451DRAFT_1164428 [Mycena latifolia]|nr:hypothetical protein FB451DRAFT_1164428 [Mycena latifolia]
MPTGEIVQGSDAEGSGSKEEAMAAPRSGSCPPLGRRFLIQRAEGARDRTRAHSTFDAPYIRGCGGGQQKERSGECEANNPCEGAGARPGQRRTKWMGAQRESLECKTWGAHAHASAPRIPSSFVFTLLVLLAHASSSCSPRYSSPKRAGAAPMGEQRKAGQRREERSGAASSMVKNTCEGAGGEAASPGSGGKNDVLWGHGEAAAALSCADENAPHKALNERLRLPYPFPLDCPFESRWERESSASTRARIPPSKMGASRAAYYWEDRSVKERREKGVRARMRQRRGKLAGNGSTGIKQRGRQYIGKASAGVEVVGEEVANGGVEGPDCGFRLRIQGRRVAVDPNLRPALHAFGRIGWRESMYVAGSSMELKRVPAQRAKAKRGSRHNALSVQKAVIVASWQPVSCVPWRGVSRALLDKTPVEAHAWSISLGRMRVLILILTKLAEKNFASI